MFLSLVFTAVTLHVTYVRSDRCPTPAEMGFCECHSGSWGFVVVCNGSLVDETTDALANIAKTNQSIFSMTLQDVWLPNLTSNLLLGSVVQLTIRSCSTLSVEEDAFDTMAASLRGLHLTHNPLERVPSQALKKCFEMTDLYLDNNRIEILHAEAFSGLDSLRHLSLRENGMKFIHNSAFVGIGRQFSFLKLGGNELTAVPYQPLRNLRSLTYLYLENNKIASLLPKEFNALMGAKSLRQFIVANNTIRHLPASVFKSTRQLYYLVLSGNAIESIHPSAFEGTEATLEYLFLKYNRLRDVPSAALKNMRGLKALNLAGNQICKIRKDDFLQYGKSITHIDLQNNSLEYLDTNAFNGLDSLDDMRLGSNQLKTLPFETFAAVSDTLHRLDIHDNPLHCDCNLSWMEKHKSWIVRMSNETKCDTPIKYANFSLAEIAIDELVCDKNTTSTPTEPCCNCFTNTQQRVSSNILITILPISFTYLLTALSAKWLF